MSLPSDWLEQITSNLTSIISGFWPIAALLGGMLLGAFVIGWILDMLSPGEEEEEAQKKYRAELFELSLTNPEELHRRAEARRAETIVARRVQSDVEELGG